MKNLRHLKWLLLAVFLLTGFSLQMHSQEVDDLQEYLDKLAAEQPVQKAQTRGGDDGTVVIPVGLTEVDLSKFSSYKNRTKELTVKASVKFVNGIISASSDFTGGTSLLKVYGGATVIIDKTSGVDANAASMKNCIQAVGIYGGSTVYQCGDIIAAGNEDGIAVFLSSSADSYYYISGRLVGQISNPYGGKVVGTKDLATYVKELQARMEAFGNDVNALQNRVVAIKQQLAELTTGTEFFMRKASSEYNNSLSVFNSHLSVTQTYIEGLIKDFNTLVNGVTITTMAQAEALDKSLKALEDRLPTADNDLTTNEGELKELVKQYEALDVNFPNEDQVYSLVPNTGVSRKDIQMGYKSNRGFVLTSSGMMFFEQVSGADFILHNQEGNYVVVTKNSSRLTAGTKAEAAVWTGINLGKGMFRFYHKGTKQYLTCSGNSVNAEMILGSKMEWKIMASDLDELQAFLNIMAEEEEEEKNGGNSGLTEDDILDVKIPETDPGNNIHPWILPKVKYWVRLRGYDVPIPNPNPGKRRPDSFHPIHIPDGSRVIIDDLRFFDNIGGHHVIYVEGILEINVNVIVNIMNWDWFIHVGPKGKVIWRPGKGVDKDWTPPRVKIDKGGTVEVVKDGYIGYIDNTGTINHTGGTVEQVINRYIYTFTGGLINFMDNYGTVTHSDGVVWKVYNREGSTYNMTGGQIVNTVVNTTEIVFYNLGTFYFKGGLLGGYGSRLIYHGPKGVMWLDGGKFDFTHIVDYFIEAHNVFYIRGDYEIPLPILLKPSVTIRVLYKWIYKWKIVFIDGKPTPRYPLFIGDGDFRISLDYIKYIDLDWPWPNKRWRWYYKDTDNSLEVRDEEVQDEDDLQAYLDWLAKNKDGEVVSTEEEPQELDLKSRKIVITKEVIVPVGSHVYFKNGQFVPKSTWTLDRVFYIPSGSSMKLENVVIDWSSSVHYYVSSKVVQRYIFDIDGVIHFGTGCHVKGWLDSTLQPSDEFIPGAAFRFAPEARIYLNGGRFDNVIFRLNTVVNLYVSANIINNIYVYVPTTCRFANFLIAMPWNYRITVADRVKFLVYGLKGWGTGLDKSNRIVLTETEELTIGDAGKTTYVGDTDLDFTGSGLTAYIVIGIEGGTLWMTPLEEVPAGTAVYVKGAKGTYYVNKTTLKKTYYENLLIGNNSDEALSVTPDGTDQYFYVGTKGFVRFTAARNIGAHKAYVRVAPLPAAKAGSSVALTISDAQRTSLCADVDLDFSNQSDLKAYTVIGYDGQIWMTQVDHVSAGTPLYVKGPKGDYTIPSSAVQAVYANMLVGNNTEASITIHPTDGEYSNYFIGKSGFSKVTSDRTVSAHKSYLQILTSYLSAGSRGVAESVLGEIECEAMAVSIADEDSETTGIRSITDGSSDDKWYDLNGHRINTPTKKGLYIKNGKKVVVK